MQQDQMQAFMAQSQGGGMGGGMRGGMGGMMGGGMGGAMGGGMGGRMGGGGMMGSFDKDQLRAFMAQNHMAQDQMGAFDDLSPAVHAAVTKNASSTSSE
eukprot:3576361-Prymnesium_polylepis.1